MNATELINELLTLPGDLSVIIPKPSHIFGMDEVTYTHVGYNVLLDKMIVTLG